MKLKRPLRGSERGADVRMVQRALNKAPSRTTILIDGIYGETSKRRVRSFEVAHSLIPNDGRFAQSTLDALWPYFDAYGRMRYRAFKVPERVLPWSHVGAVTKRRFLPVIWDKSLLDHSLTHKSSGLPRNDAEVTLWPAVDLAWGAGVRMYAPEDVEVDTKDTGASPGEALYLTGKSKLRYWFAHLDRDYPLGKKFSKGQFIAKTVDTAKGGGPHGHVAVNGEAHLGEGKQFLYGRDGTGPDYTHGAPTVGDQLTKALA